MPRGLTKLSHHHMAFILFKIGGYRNRDISDFLDIAEGTLINWGKDPLIRQMRVSVEEDLRGGARRYLDSLLPEAIFTLAKIMRTGGTERIRLDAASRILDKALPAESIQTHQGDPSKPIFFDMLKSADDQATMNSAEHLSPEDKAKLAEAIEQLENLANAGATGATEAS